MKEVLTNRNAQYFGSFDERFHTNCTFIKSKLIFLSELLCVNNFMQQFNQFCSSLNGVSLISIILRLSLKCNSVNSSHLNTRYIQSSIPQCPDRRILVKWVVLYPSSSVKSILSTALPTFSKANSCNLNKADAANDRRNTCAKEKEYRLIEHHLLIGIIIH